tara:strand:- start:1452 stop:1673 length:222 start_codon:yes stop_codon:yes gene_type:complete
MTQASLRDQLKRNKTVRGRRWIVKRDLNRDIKEVKMIYNPDEYEQFSASKPMVGDKALLEILEKNYEDKKIKA